MHFIPLPRSARSPHGDPSLIMMVPDCQAPKVEIPPEPSGAALWVPAPLPHFGFDMKDKRSSADRWGTPPTYSPNPPAYALVLDTA